MTLQLCIPIHRSPGTALLNQHEFCIPIDLQYVPRDRIGPPIPPEDPFLHLQALGTIAQLAASLSDRIPMRQELVEVATRALESAVAGLGDGFHLVESEAVVGQA
jgi:hypothetical protein